MPKTRPLKKLVRVIERKRSKQSGSRFRSFDPTDIHDKNYHQKFTLVAKEFLDRLETIERESE